ncbi:hypothetical protein CHELA20_53964 [Hyphomicrobiales bacterium]|nr:hypothetical protein CHELA41_20963 [Hyphomicrobiales bacterium]CAH1685316.1 hypothetical protein CHELA20_53964 [Hyphomicrobiales bacterium]
MSGCVRPRVLVSSKIIGISVVVPKPLASDANNMPLTDIAFDESNHPNSRKRFQTVRGFACLLRFQGPSCGGCPTAI